METTTETSKRKLEVRCDPQVRNPKVVACDEIVLQKALIKYVIGATPTAEQQSILKKTINSQTSTIAPTALLTQNSIIKSTLIARPDSTTNAKVPQQSTATSTPGECLQLPTTSAGQNLIKLPLNKKFQTNTTKQVPKSRSNTSIITNKHLDMNKTFGHLIYQQKNDAKAKPLSAIITGPIVSQELAPRKLPTIKDIQSSTLLKRVEVKPQNNNIVINNKHNFETPISAEVTQITSTVTLTKASATVSKQMKPQLPPLVTIERKPSKMQVNPQNNIQRPSNIKPDKMVAFSKEPTLAVKQTSLLKRMTSQTSSDKMLMKPPAQKIKQQSLLKVNTTNQSITTSPRTKRSKSLNAIGSTINRRKAIHKPCRRLSTGLDELQNSEQIPEVSLIPIRDTSKSPSDKPSKPTLLCNETIESIPSSSSNSSIEGSSKKQSTEAIDNSCLMRINSFKLNTLLEMLSAFNMLDWRDTIGTCNQSSIKYRLNEFNLLEIHEICPPRDHIRVAYEKPIYEREYSANTSDYSDPLYHCRRCGFRGPGVDFLAPEFCSYECYRRNNRKRVKCQPNNIRDKMIKERVKRPRKMPSEYLVESEADIKEILNGIAPKRFTWDTHINECRATPAPVDLFLNPYPCGANMFEIGMKLEAIDPENNSLFCVCTVMEKIGYRLKLQFDGYSQVYNFWVNADSMDIFPPGWCAKTNRVLQPPMAMNLLTFNWPTYLTKTNCTPAPRALFTHLNSASSTNRFKVGMRLEANNLKNTGKLCVASVADVLDNRILVHFDGCDERYNYWTDINSPYIHPLGWHQLERVELQPPPGWKDCFSWAEYLKSSNFESAHSSMFSPRAPMEFTAGLKLEAVDPKNHCLIRPATVISCKEYKVLLHLDGFSDDITFWVNDDSPDIHPVGWAEATGHPLEPPPGFEQLPPNMPCPVRGCRGIGNSRRHDFDFHANEDTCPYYSSNWHSNIGKPMRIDDIIKIFYIREISANQRKPTNEKPAIESIPEEQSITTKKDIENKKAEVATQSVTIQSSTNESKPRNQSVAKEIKLAKEFLCDYGPRLRQNYLIWRENSNYDPDLIVKNPLEWTTRETAEYISTMCHPIGHLFEMQDIDGLAFLNMSQSDLTNILKIKLGPAVKIFSHILHLRTEVVTRFNNKVKSTDI